MTRNEKQKIQMYKDFILTMHGQTYDAIKAAQAMRERWGIDADWHDMSTALSSLHNSGQIGFVGHSNSGTMVIYHID